MNSLSKRDKILLGILGVAVFVCLYYILFLSPFINKIDAANGRVEQCKVEVQKIKDARNNIDKLKEEFEQLKITLEKYLEAVPEMEKNPEIAYNLKKLGDTNKVNISTLSIGEPSEVKSDSKDTKTETKTDAKANAKTNTAANSSTDVKTMKKLYIIPVSINAKGDYDPIMNYINSIEHDKRIAAINGAAITSNSQNGDLMLSLTMNYYYTGRITDKVIDYGFNTGIYGKNNLFK